MLSFSLLGSGSSGNASLVWNGASRILIDAGFSFKQLEERATKIGQELGGLDAVFVTHEHIDHVNGLGVLARRTGAPIYLTPETHAALPPKVGRLENVRFFEPGDRIPVGELVVTSFSISHDAADPVSYTVECGGAKLGFATDLGHPSQLVRSRLAGCQALVLEANYCPERLRNGKYPPQVQQRIRSRIGHLSNQDMASLLSELLHDDLQTVVLFHISANNNAPEVVRSMADGVVRDRPVAVHIALQDRPTPLFEVHP